MTTPTSAPKGLLLKADTIASPYLTELQTAISSRPRKPRLVGILSTSSAPSRSYAEFTKRQCEALGLEFVLREVGAAVGGGEGEKGEGEGEGVEEAIVEANGDKGVDGIMVSRFSVIFELWYGTDLMWLEGVLSDFRCTTSRLGCRESL